MKGTMDVLYCDHEDGCGDWTPDYYAMDVSNWRDLLKGWTYNPYQDREGALCPFHTKEANALPPGLCGSREDHAPHRHESASLGAFWCEADQTKRLPYAMERKAR